MEITIFIITILGFGIAYLTYKKDHIDKPKDEALNLSSKYLFSRRSTEELIQELEEYAIGNNVLDEQFMQGLTFNEGITFLKNAYHKLFDMDISEDIKKSSGVVNNDIAVSIDNHIKHTQEIRTYFKFYVKKDFSA